MPLVPGRSRSRTSRFGPIEIASAFAIGGSVLAVGVPTFVRQVRLSRFVEPVQGLEEISAAALAYASTHPVAHAFPPSAPLTPPVPPRGRPAVDAPELWEQPTWTALAFRPSPPGEPHCFSFSFDSTASPSRSTFRADAHGDLDGDGILSTFEVSGEVSEGDPRGPIAAPGMFVDSEVE